MAGAISGTTIASLLAMAAGSALQYKATTDAQKRQQQETMRSILRQNDFQNQAEKKALGQAEEFNTDKRLGEQSQLEAQLNEAFIKPVESAQQINSQVATTQGDVSQDYTKAQAASQLNIMKSARTLAGLMAKTTSAGRLRTNEAIRMADTAAGIDRLGSFARGTALADEIGIKAAGRPDASMVVGGQLLSGIGSLGMSGAGAAGTSGATAGTGVSATASTTAHNISDAANMALPLAGSTSGGIGFNGLGTTGFRLPIKVTGV